MAVEGIREVDHGRWGVETLREHIVAILAERDLRYQQRFDASQQALGAALAAQEKAVGVALQSAEKATLKAESASSDRFESVNKFRETLTDQARTFMPRPEFESTIVAMTARSAAEMKALHEAVDRIETRLNIMEGRRAGLAAIIAWGVGIAGVLIAALSLIFRASAQ